MSLALRDHPLLLLLVFFPLLYGVVELGFWWVRKKRLVDEKYHEQFASTRDQAGVLLSLLLGFTLAMALSRYDLRKQMAVDEADAISTTELRASLLPEPERGRALALFREYVDARIAFTNAGLDEEKLARAEADSARIQKDLWAIAVTASEQNPSPITALFVESLNETIDADDQRLAALENRIPRAIWIMLGLLSIGSSLLVGLSLRTRSPLAMIIPPLMFVVVTLLVADLDTPGAGLIHTHAQSIERLK